MSRLSEQEINVIRQARAASQRDASTRTDVYVAARENRNDGLGHLLGRASAAIGRATGLADAWAVINRFVITPARDGMARRQTTAQLRKMDDRMLRDIGIERGTLYGLSEDLHLAQTVQTKPRGGILAWLIKRYHRWSSLRELRALDDRMLEDIGLTRGELPAAVDAILAAEASGQQSDGNGATTTAKPQRPIHDTGWLNLNRRLVTEIANLGPIMISPEGHMKSVKKVDRAA